MSGSSSSSKQLYVPKTATGGQLAADSSSLPTNTTASPSVDPSKPRKLKSTKIVIIGAGIAGLSCAKHLRSEGFDNVVILEAQNRIGGRIHTVDVQGAGFLEMGAQWIHGSSTDNVMFRYANNHELVDLENSIEYYFQENASTWDMDFCLESGKLVEKELASNVWALFGEASADANENCKDKNVVTYLHGSVQRELQNSRLDVDKKLLLDLFTWSCLFEQISDGCDNLAEKSVRSWSRYKHCNGNQLVSLKYGYKAVLDRILASVSADILLEKKVKHIEFSTKDLSLSDQKTWPTPIRIHLTTGERVDADHVVCTISLGCLKEKGASFFSPKLPSAKWRTIEEISFGTVNKIYLIFDRSIWAKNFSGYAFIWDTEKDEQLSRSKAPMDTIWFRKIAGFFRIPIQPNVLCGWISGKEARYMETLSDDMVLKTSLSLLEQFAGSTTKMPKLKQMIRTAWYSNPYTRGSYSNLSSKGENAEFRYMEAPLVVNGLANECVVEYPIILFAGEATNARHFSTVHGAMETGIREAQRLTDFYNSIESPNCEKPPKAKL